jgi:hypothetical protein
MGETAFGRSFCLLVPELTGSADIKLNERVSLRSQRTALCKRTGNFQHPDPPWQSRRAIIFRSAALLSHEVVEHADPSGNTSTAT